MRDRWKARPQLESLEAMTLLSGTAATVLPLHDHSEIAVTPAQDSSLTLSGTEQGVFLAHRSTGKGVGILVSEKAYKIAVAGKLTPIGSTAVSGNLQVALGISSGPPGGTLNLITGKGTLTLAIPKSVEIPSGLPNPTSTNEIIDTYVITKGAGAYEGDTGSGVVIFRFKDMKSVGARTQVGQVDITFTRVINTPPTA